MSINKQSLSQIAVSGMLVLSLPACTIAPVDPDSRVGQATEKLSAAGSSLWKKTKHVMRLDGTDAYNGRPAVASNETSDEFQNEVDLALLNDGQTDTDALIGSDGELVVLSPVADNDGLINTTPQVGEIVVTENTLVEQPAIIQPQQPTVVAQTEATQPAPAEVILQDYEHEVGDNETLWDLSKQLTGDATNWKVLAELNNLGPNGAVFPGTKLIVPADMLKDPGQVQMVAAQTSIETNTAATTETIIEETAQVASNERVQIPQADAVAVVTDIVAAEKPVEAYDGPKTGFGVQASETLWDLAKRTTGDATNWKAIAAANGMSEKEATFIKYGQTIDVPDELLKTASGSEIAAVNPVAQPEATSEPTELAAAQPAAEDAAAERTVIEVTAAATEVAPAATTEQELTIIPTTFKSEPLVVDEAATDNTAVAVAPAGDGKTITVSGTYYPKAVYNDANFSASLLMRVSPGTELDVIRALGPWYEVRTEQGIGFVHSRDIK